MATHNDDMATATPPSAASRTSTDTTSSHTTTASTCATDRIAQRVSDFVTKPARSAIQEYLRINAAASYLSATAEGRVGKSLPIQPSSHQVGEGRKAAACIVGCLLENKFSPNKSKAAQAAQAAVLNYLAADQQLAGQVTSTFSGSTKVHFIQLVKSIIQGVEDKGDDAFDELMRACNDGD